MGHSPLSHNMKKNVGDPIIPIDRGKDGSHSNDFQIPDQFSGQGSGPLFSAKLNQR
jgi:hypothetical protein